MLYQLCHRLACLHLMMGSIFMTNAVEDPSAYLSRATAIFPETVVGHDGLTETLTFGE